MCVVFIKALEVRLADLARGFEEATIDKNEQEDKTIKMRKILDTAAQLRRVSQLSCSPCRPVMLVLGQKFQIWKATEKIVQDVGKGA